MSVEKLTSTISQIALENNPENRKISAAQAQKILEAGGQKWTKAEIEVLQNFNSQYELEDDARALLQAKLLTSKPNTARFIGKHALKGMKKGAIIGSISGGGVGLVVAGAVVATTGPGALIAIPLLTIGCAAGGAITGAEIGGVAGTIKGVAKD